MALGNLFKLAKLRIESFYDVARSRPLHAGFAGSNTLEVMYNPESLSTHHESVYQWRQGFGSQGSSIPWSHSRSRELTVKLVFDGTGVGQFGAEKLLRSAPTVAEWIRTFLSMCYDVQSESHESAYLRLKWSTDIFGRDGFECRLRSADIQYTAFDRDGSPLHAELTAKFVESVDPKKKSAQLRLSSPDLTHRRVVRDGDTLPQLCREIYGSPDHYLRVAEVNGLDDFRSLTPGQELLFPPFARDERP